MSLPGASAARFAALLCATALLAAAAHAARPMITDDARVVDPKACQLESWVRSNRGSTEYWAIPACNFTGNLELSLGGAQTREAGNTTTTDQLVQGKTVFKPLTPNGWGWGLVAGANHHPSAGGGSDWYSYVPASFSFRDDAVVLHTNIGWQRVQDTRRQALTWGLGSETRLTGRAWLIAEAFGADHGDSTFQMGIRYWLLPERVQIDTTYGDQIGGTSHGRWLSIGLRLLSVPFLR